MNEAAVKYKKRVEGWGRRGRVRFGDMSLLGLTRMPQVSISFKGNAPYTTEYL